MKRNAIMTPNQYCRASELIHEAGKRLNYCSKEDLGFNDGSRAALESAREALEDFRLQVLDQPKGSCL